MKNFKYLLIGVLCLQLLPIFGQMRYGSIEYEIRTNLDKRFPPTNSNAGNFRSGGRGGNFNSSSNSGSGNYLIEKAVLYFTDSVSLYVTELSENINDQRKTFTNVTQHNIIEGQFETQINLLGENFIIKDAAPKRIWKFTGKVRDIAGVECPQAITTLEDGTKIYAWFDTDMIPSIGPESYWDLPGAILGLAYEDGSVTYFATKINSDFPTEFEQFKASTSKKVYSRADFIKEFEKKYDTGNRYYQLIQDLVHFF